MIDRRLLLVLSSVVYASGFALWVVWPTYAGFAIGFVLWGLSGALMSGTFEAYLYDELVATGNAAMYARLLGRAESAAMVASLAATAIGAPLFALGGYSMVGWVSVAAALVDGAFALSLPAAPTSGTTDETMVTAGGTAGTTLIERYVTMLRSGWREATQHRTVRHIVLISAVLMGVSAYDEYFGLLARETGASTADIPLLMAVVAVGQVGGAALAGRTATWSRRRLAVLVGIAGVLVAAGALTGHPIGILGIAAGYGLAHNAMVVADARLQAVITGPARATVTSVAGFSSEMFAIGCYATFAVGSWWLTTGTLIASCASPSLASPVRCGCGGPTRRGDQSTMPVVAHVGRRCGICESSTPISAGYRASGAHGSPGRAGAVGHGVILGV